MILRLSTFITVLLIMVGCSESVDEIHEQSGEVSSSVSASSPSDQDRIDLIERTQKEDEVRLAEENAASTTIKFDRLKHDFGNVKPDSDNTTEFIVYNTGDKPLILTDVSASCGCTTPQKPEGPIAPGKSDVIKVTFHPKPGQVDEIKKSITVTANTAEKIHLLEIRAFVTK